MKAFAVLLAIVASCQAGGLTGYTSNSYVQHAHHVAAGPIIAPQPAVYAHQTFAAPIAKTIVPAASSYSYANRAPAARLAVAAPVYASAPLHVAPLHAAPLHAAPIHSAYGYGAHLF